MVTSRLNPQCFATIRLIATDMDGTLTCDRHFRPALLTWLEQLHKADIKVIIVTGRSAGWASAIAHYFPVQGVIAENGGVFCPSDRTVDTTAPQFLCAIGNEQAHRRALAQQFANLQTAYPQLQPAADNPYRRTDWTFDVAGLSQAEIQDLGDRCRAAGWDFTYSTVQCHIKLPGQAKSAGLQQVLRNHFPGIQPTEIVTIGDSPNDESLFNAERFPHTVGVANIQPYLAHLNHQPKYLTQASEAEGFGELVAAILANQE